MTDIVLITTLVNAFAAIARAGQNSAAGGSANSPAQESAAPTRLGRIRKHLRHEFRGVLVPFFLMIVGMVLLSLNGTLDSSTWLHNTALVLVAASIVHQLERLRANIATDVATKLRYDEPLRAKEAKGESLNSARLAALGANQMWHSDHGTASSDRDNHTP